MAFDTSFNFGANATAKPSPGAGKAKSEPKKSRTGKQWRDKMGRKVSNRFAAAGGS